MKKLLPWTIFIAVSVLALMTNCRKEVIHYNQPPVADAGTQQLVVLPKDSAQLTGTNSYDPDGAISTFHWAKIAGGNCLIVNPNAPTTMVRSLNAGLYQFELTVTDDVFASSKDTVQITVTASDGSMKPPVAIAGSDQQLYYPFNSCTLDGSSSYDPDGNILSYLWNKISGPDSYVLSDRNSARTTLSSLTTGTYQFELVVTDNSGLTGRDTLKLSVFVSGNCDMNNRPQVGFNKTELGSLSVARIPAVAAAGTKIVFAGGPYRSTGGSWSVEEGTDAVDIYDVESHTWTTAKLSEPRMDIAAISCGNKIFFAGGGNPYEGTTNVDIYDVSANTWSVEHLSEPRTAVSAATIGTKVFFAGGTTNWAFGTTRVDIYDIATGAWSTAELSQPKYLISTFTKDNKVYFVGGTDFEQGFNSIDIYDNSTGTWLTGTIPPNYYDIQGVNAGDKFFWLYYGHNGIEIRNDAGFITNGCVTTPRVWTNTNKEILFHDYSSIIEIYNFTTGIWYVGQLQAPLIRASVVQLKNKIYVAGGWYDTNAYSNKVYMLEW